MKIIDQNYINGEFKKIDSSKSLTLKNPTTEEEIAQIYLSMPSEMDEAIHCAATTFESFSKTSIQERMEILQHIHDELIKHEERLIDLAVLEFGATITTTRRRTKNAINLFLAIKEELKSYDFIKKDDYSITIKEGVGVIGVIIPWNANLAHLCSNIAPAIALGCTLVIKPSEFNALETQAFLECLHRANVPKGVVNVVHGTGESVGEILTKHPLVNAISFIGSTKTGKKIFENCSKTIKRMTLELGGKSPTILLEDANLAKVIPHVLSSAYSNSGQACHAGSRLLVPKAKLNEVKRLLLETIQKLTIGDPKNEETKIGPMINQTQFNTVQAYIKSGIEEGAQLLCGGLGRVQEFEKGYFVKPTVFICHDQTLKIVQEEIFGPVLCVLPYESEQEALSMANDTLFGLSAYVFSSDETKAYEFAKQIRSGRVLINTAASKAKNPPFGGMKQSGLGRMGGRYSMDAFCEIKSILF
ncbi:aldehyde dehydrogenase family protein [Sulfurospirillum multivorans]|uniref:Aldehyde dehydrogenase n=2 Tax=Sulfurospirillum multivorans TaxID=66821 RepID=A0AA86AIW5_SULMK|nr:aldehyde dehydrogenase family protein [Sulfurospirillum multivorans]AHJ11495.1 aldehyde dehydrogenase [Sulfurospirillum multivorans DSM 12446]QEH04996.1 aldehyde dehydrogenase [Sulfurospirillum multivorans]